MPIITIIPATVISQRGKNTFIKRHGYVKYPVCRQTARKVLEKTYTVSGQCEVIGCDLKKITDRIEARLANPTQDYQWNLNFPEWLEPSMLDYQDFDGPNREEEYIEMISIAIRHGRRHDKRIRQPSLLFDHCHKHGWIRGLICNSCNTIIGRIEAEGKWEGFPEGPTPLYKQYLNNCPECTSPTTHK